MDFGLHRNDGGRGVAGGGCTGLVGAMEAGIPAFAGMTGVGAVLKRSHRQVPMPVGELS